MQDICTFVYQRLDETLGVVAWAVGLVPRSPEAVGRRFDAILCGVCSTIGAAPRIGPPLCMTAFGLAKGCRGRVGGPPQWGQCGTAAEVRGMVPGRLLDAVPAESMALIYDAGLGPCRLLTTANITHWEMNSATLTQTNLSQLSGV